MCTLTKRGLFAFLSQVDPCKATVTQRADGEFVPGKQQHNHPGKVGAALAARITARTKKEAVANLFKPVSAIVNQVLLEELTDAPCPSLPKPTDPFSLHYRFVVAIPAVTSYLPPISSLIILDILGANSIK